MGGSFDILIIGSGAAGLSLALQTADNAKVAILSKGDLSAGSTSWAQGGIAAVLGEDDTIQSHIEDTLIAGDGLCDEDTVSFVVRQGHKAIDDLIKNGVHFSENNKMEDGYGYHLTQEGGHSHRRVIHVDDATGAAVQTTLEEKVLKHPNITVFENHIAIDLITNRNLVEYALGGDETCFGAYVFDIKAEKTKTISARTTVLATGGASRVYLYTSNPDGSTGDGIAMAWRAGCEVANMEFNQFHPTCLFHAEAKSFLISEALRGEGAKLLLPSGEQFMKRYDPRAELAPRDVVARAIDAEMKKLGLDFVYLDISHRSQDFIIGQFPNIYRRCRELGFDITKEPIPVVPAAHYTCGGIVTDLDGRANLGNLYAIGETSYTGLHGANRMASNSLLECLVYASSAAKHIVENIDKIANPPAIRLWDESNVVDSDEEVVVSHNWKELRHLMWDYVGIVRTDKRLERALRRIEMLEGEIQDYYGNFHITKDLLELRNIVTTAELIVRCAMARKESRGLHYTTDYPETLAEAKNTILTPEKQ